MATSAATLIQRSRRFLQDWPDIDALGASCTAVATTVTVPDTGIYQTGSLIQIGTEALRVKGNGGVTALVVSRGAYGTTAATHASGDSIMVRPRFLDTHYLDGLNAGINATFPWLYQPVTSEYSGVISTGYEYAVPVVNSVPIPYISKLEFREAADLAYRDFNGWTVMRGSSPFIKLRRLLPDGGSLRISGFGPLPNLSSLSDSLSSLFPVNAEDALVMFTAQYLLAASEAARVREDTGARDQRDNANRPGSAMTAANQVLNRFQRRIMDSGMPPMPKHIVSVL